MCQVHQIRPQTQNPRHLTANLRRIYRLIKRIYQYSQQFVGKV